MSRINIMSWEVVLMTEHQWWFECKEQTESLHIETKSSINVCKSEEAPKGALENSKIRNSITAQYSGSTYRPMRNLYCDHTCKKAQTVFKTVASRIERANQRFLHRTNDRLCQQHMRPRPNSVERPRPNSVNQKN